MCNEYERHPFPQAEVDLWSAAGRSITPKVQKQIDHIANGLAVYSPVTGKHSENVAGYVERIATAASLPQPAITGLKQAARLHDLGKLTMPKDLLESDKKFSAAELSDFRHHATSGHDLIKSFTDLPAPFRFLAAQMARSHHEQFNGEGLDARANRGVYQEAVGEKIALMEMNSPTNPQAVGKFDPSLLALLTSTFKNAKAAPHC